jgi:hypothetical protein
MSMERVFINVVATIATSAAVIKFALFEWEGIVRAWRKVSTVGKPRGTTN